jgi:hypothetical protein
MQLGNFAWANAAFSPKDIFAVVFAEAIATFAALKVSAAIPASNRVIARSR